MSKGGVRLKLGAVIQRREALALVLLLFPPHEQASKFSKGEQACQRISLPLVACQVS